MTDANIIILALSALTAVGMLAGAMLVGWHGWLELKRTELDQAQTGRAVVPAAGARIEIADLRERIRKLEAIAAGVDL